MRPLLNVLFVTRPDVYIGLKDENVIIRDDNTILLRYPLLNIEGIVSFSNLGVSPALLGICAQRNISVCFLTPSGRFRARVIGPTKGNVLLRKKQYQVSDDELKSLHISKNFIMGKVYNEKWQIERYIRQYPMRLPIDKMKQCSIELNNYLSKIRDCNDMDQLRGYEGLSQVCYFSAFDDMILNQKESFYFKGRNKRPPLDRVNCLLSFAYTLLTNDIAAALESVGLDPYVGFMHTDRPGRVSLATDMIEEFRAPIADRFVLSLINKKRLNSSHFEIQENGAVYTNEEAIKIFYKSWHDSKEEKIKHPYLGEKIPWGLVPYAQALLLARLLRDDLDEYPPFFWK